MATKNGAAGEKKHRRLFKYRECLRNHGLLAQLYTLDGCGEFSPSREDPKLCAACNCSRNYHRREEVVKQPRVAPLPTATAALPLPPPPPPSSHRSPPRLQPVHPPPAPLRKTIPRYRPKTPNPPRIEAGSKAVDGGEEETKKKKKKKKPKTKFTEAQRVRMREFAEKLGWRIIKRDEEGIEKLCEEIGITPQVYKFWINNNRRRIELGESSSVPKA